MTAHPLYATLLALLSVCSTAGAQVLRCEDAQGRVTYTNTTCPHDQRMQEVAPPLSAEEQARQDAQYQQALERKREQQLLRAEQEAAQRKAEAERAAAAAAKRPPQPIIVQEPQAPPASPVYVPVPVPQRPPMHRPVPPPPPAHKPHPDGAGYHCNVFRCWDGKGNVWTRP
ncbi:DUF4124 domain-containing protein [Comamonas kerstersii]|nr:DUF4124 domain-containing protein [Comamonas kerstersii]KUF40974.1 hypothetical protein AS359_09095 [Comamonas kerstersii]MDO4970372.1 DUF4124 domain-containing protein [Comamonadaceae bacterium]QTW20167.1 DUF4124 domain-containing protein [Comamonas kerstersii]